MTTPIFTTADQSRTTQGNSPAQAATDYRAAAEVAMLTAPAAAPVVGPSVVQGVCITAAAAEWHDIDHLHFEQTDQGLVLYDCSLTGKYHPDLCAYVRHVGQVGPLVVLLVHEPPASILVDGAYMNFEKPADRCYILSAAEVAHYPALAALLPELRYE